MSDSMPQALKSRRWLDWPTDDPITADSARSEPTKPSKPGFEGFDGSVSAQVAEISASGIELPEEPKTPIDSAVDCASAQERVMSWSQWKAATLNRLFGELGTSRQPGKITAETVLHGEERMNRITQQRRNAGADA